MITKIMTVPSPSFLRRTSPTACGGAASSSSALSISQIAACCLTAALVVAASAAVVDGAEEAADDNNPCLLYLAQSTIPNGTRPFVSLFAVFFFLSPMIFLIALRPLSSPSPLSLSWCLDIDGSASHLTPRTHTNNSRPRSIRRSTLPRGGTGRTRGRCRLPGSRSGLAQLSQRRRDGFEARGRLSLASYELRLERSRHRYG